MQPSASIRAPVAGLPAAAGILAGLILYLCFFAHLDALGLVGPDEPRYADVAREMARSGDWITPRLDGKPWFEKPVLYYWAAAISFRLFGVSEFSARLPSAMAALAATAALVWAAFRLYGGATAWAVLLMFPTTLGVFGFARAATTDMLFSACLTLTMLAAAALVWPERFWAGGSKDPSLHSRAMVFGALLGAATLAKGPAAIVLAGGSIGLWAVWTRRWRAMRADTLRLRSGQAQVRPYVAAAFVGFGAVAVPWYALCAWRNPEFVSTFLVTHNLARYLTPVFQHSQPVWFYAPILLLGLVPWTVLLAGVARDAAHKWREKSLDDSPGFFFACWAMFPVAFFSLSQSKLPGYVLPVLAPLALLLARSAVRATEEKRRAAQWLAGGTGATYIALGLSAGLWLKRVPSETGLGQSPELAIGLGIAIAMGVVIAVLGLAGRFLLALALSALLMAALVEAANRRFVPLLDAYLSPRQAAHALPRGPGQREPVFTFRLHRARRFGLNFYLDRDLREWTEQSPRPAWVYTSAEGLAELERKGVRFYAAQLGARPGESVRGGPAILVRVEP